MKLITNTIICLIIVFTSNLLNISIAFAQDNEQSTTEQSTIVTVPSEDPNAKDTIYE